MTKIISVFSKGKRQDIPADEFVKMLEKGGPGSGRYPEGSSGEYKTVPSANANTGIMRKPSIVRTEEKDAKSKLNQKELKSYYRNRWNGYSHKSAMEELEKGGPGSGRKPEGKSVGDEEKSNRGMGFTIDEKSKGNLGLKATGQYWATGNKTDKVTPFGNFSETEVEHESGSKHWVPTGNAQMMGYLKMGKQ